ncbi:MAG: cadherin domain-containing protein [Acidobacteriota bacterium]|nr:cadherin domain-containing protein [Acidobacteriota bacterium]
MRANRLLPLTSRTRLVAFLCALICLSLTAQAAAQTELHIVRSTSESGTSKVEGSNLVFDVGVAGSSSPSSDLTVNLTVAEGTGEDFVAAGNEGQKTLTFSMGTSTTTFTVATVNDSTVESDGTVTVTLNSGTGYTVDSNFASASWTVTDNDVGLSSVAFHGTPAAGQDDKYKIGDTVTARATFSGAVDVTGSPTLELLLATGTTRTMTASAATNTTTVDFTYTVAAGDVSAGLSIGANKLSVPTGSTIVLTGTTSNAVVTHSAVAVDTDRKIDGVKPTFTSATVDGTTLKVTFSEALRSASSSWFTVSWTATSTKTSVGQSADASISDKVATVTLQKEVPAGVSTQLAHGSPGTGNAARDKAGNAADDFSGKPVTNLQGFTAPAFDDGDDVTFEIAENNADAASVGTVSATDGDGDTPTFSLANSGDHASFTINSSSGEIKVASGTTLNFEAKDEYTITAQVTDGEDANGNAETTATIDDTITVTIEVTNVLEPPARMAAPTVTSASPTALTVTWTPPSETGAKAITSYRVRYFQGAADPDNNSEWTNAGTTFTASTRTTDIGGLTPGKLYRVQTRARADGGSPWSPSGLFTTPLGRVRAILVSSKAPGGQNFAYKIGDTVTVALAFDSFVTLTGDLVAKLLLASGVERNATFTDTSGTARKTMLLSYTVQAGDTSSGLGFAANKVSLRTATSTIVTTGTSVAPSLAHPAVGASTSQKVDGVLPTVQSATVEQDELRVTFAEAMKTSGTKPASSIFTVSATKDGATTTINGASSAVTISGSTVTAALSSSVDHLATLTVAYAVPTANALADAAGNEAAAFSNQSATNDVGNTSPSFDDGATAAFSIAENNADQAVVGTVSATDNDGDTPTYSLASGGDNDSFTIDSGTGQIKVASGTTLDFETQDEFTITARVTDREDDDGNTQTTPTQDDTITVTVTVTNVEEPPGVPTGLSVTAASTTALNVTWVAPTSTGARAINDYDVRYFAGSADPTDPNDWIEEGETGGFNHTGTAVSAVVGSLTPDTTYRVQVRAGGDGEGAWSASGSAKTKLPKITGVAFVGSPATHQGNWYGIGNTVRARATFDYAVDVTGDPILELWLFRDHQNRDVTKNMTFDTHGDRTSTTTVDFIYTVAALDVSGGLRIDANKLSLPASVKITAAGFATKNAVITHGAVAVDTSRRIDGTGPRHNSAVVRDNKLQVTFNEDINENVTAPASSVFTVKGTNNGTAFTINGGTAAVTVNGSLVTATLASSVAATATGLTVEYAVPASNELVDKAGNAAAAFTGLSATNNTHTSPSFTAGASTEFMIAENNAAQAVVGSVSASDLDGDTMTWSLASGSDSASFTINSANGEIKVASGTTFDYETKDEYTFTAQVTDGEDSNGTAEGTPTIDDTIAVTVTVTNVEEVPGAPHGLRATPTATSVEVSWVAPTTTGGGSVTDYDLRYSTGAGPPQNDDDWIEEGEAGGHTHTGPALQSTVENLTPGTRYHFSVRAEGDGEGPWSSAVTATTTLPTVSSVELTSTPEENRSYDTGEFVRARVTFDDAVDVTVGPVLTLQLGAGETREMTFDPAGGTTGTTTVDFTYSVVEGDVSRAGIAFPENALGAGTGAIQVAGSTTSADLTHPAVAANSDHRVNWTAPPPAPPGGGGGPPPPLAEPPLAEDDPPQANGPEVTLTFDRPLDPASVPDPSDFTVTVTLAASSAASAATDPETVAAAQEGEYRVTEVSISGSTVRLTISPPIPAGASVSVQYTKGANPLRVSDGQPTPTYREVPDFEEEVTNETPSGGGEPEPTNSPPVADAGEDLEVAPGARVELDGTGSSDPDGDELTFLWTQTGGEEVTLEGADRARPSFAAPQAAGTLTFALVVNDGSADSEPDTVTVSVSRSMPVADAGEDLEVDPGALVELDGTGSSDPDGDELTFRWTQTGGDDVTLEGADTARPSFTVPQAAVALTFSLVVNDGTADSEPDEVTVLVRDLMPSFGDAEIGTKRFLANQPARPRVLPAASGGNGALTYTLEPLPAGLEFDDSSRRLHGTPTAAGRFTVTYSATDIDGDVASLEFLIRVFDNRPPTADAGEDLETDPGERVELDGTGSSDPDGDELSYAWLQTEGETVTLEQPLSARPAFTAPVQPGMLTFSLTVKDGMATSEPDEVAVRVRDLAPTFGGATVQALTLVQGRAIDPVELPEATGGNGALTYSLTSSPMGLAGLDFDLPTRTLSGTPTATGAWTFTYRVEDADNHRGDSDAALMIFRVTSAPPTAERRAVLEQTLASVGRTALNSAVDAIGARFSSTGTPRSNVTIAGRQLTGGGPGIAGRQGGGLGGYGGPGGPRGFGLGFGQGPGRGFGQGSGQGFGGPGALRTDADSLLLGSSFEWSFGGGAEEAGEGDEEAGPRLWSVWGRGDLNSFNGRPEQDSRFEGDLRTGYVGVDVQSGRWLAGVAVSRGSSESDYSFGGGDADFERGGLDTSLTTVHPYGRWKLSDTDELWTVLGLGWGDATHVTGDAADRPESSDLSMYMAAGGLRKALAAFRGVDLALRADAGLARLETDGGSRAVDGLSAGSWRMRAGVEASRSWMVTGGGVVTPFVELAGRYDGGDGATGLGVEVAGGARYGNARFQVEARGRMLALHNESGYEESGVSVSARMAPKANGEGLSMELGPRWGAPVGGAETLWQEQLPRHQGGAFGSAGGRGGHGVDAALGYGFLLPAFQGVLTPFAEAAFAGQGRRYRLGTRFIVAPIELQLELAGEQVEAAGNVPGQRRFAFNLRFRF